MISLLDDFMVRAALAGLGVAVAAAPLGCFVLWRRMAYFGEATAHAAILGVALALSLSLPMMPAVLLAALAMGLTVGALTRRGHAMDSVLGVLAHSALALGLVAVALFTNVRVDLLTFLFGDILAVTPGDLAIIWGGGAVVVALLVWRWNALLTATLHPDLAWSCGINPDREEQGLILALALIVALAIKVVGVLLIASMLIIPAAAARSMASTPERMALGAGLVGGCAALGGLWASYILDTPTGPSIVCVAAGLFLISSVLSALRR